MVARSYAALAALALCTLVVAACGDDSDDAERRPSTTAPAASEPAGGCAEVTAPKRRREPRLRKPSAALDRGKRFDAVVATSCGSFTIALDVARAPETTASFAALARRGFYDGLSFHRIVPGFVVQAGDPRGDGTGGPGYGVTEEPPSDLAYTRGVVAMAKTETEPAGRSGSQFFVVAGEDTGLPPEYALLGTVTRGLDVIDRIAGVPTDSDDEPLDPIVIRSIRISAVGRR